MSTSKDNSTSYEQFNSPGLEYIQDELNNWERIIFQGEMDRSRKQGEISSDSADCPSISSTSTDIDIARTYLPGAAAPQVPPEAYNYLIQALLSMQGAITPPAAYNQHVPYLQGRPSTSSTSPHVPHQAILSNFPLAMQYTGSLSQLSSASSHTPAMVTPYLTSFHSRNSDNASSNTTPSDEDDTADEAIAIAEDKRRRNTSASARFRIKKKQKTHNLERSVADLARRTEELEREASNLRRENSWLKEIMLLKGGRMGALSSNSSQQSNTS